VERPAIPSSRSGPSASRTAKGNHGEGREEVTTSTVEPRRRHHSYMKYLYKLSAKREVYPYLRDLVETNGRRSKGRTRVRAASTRGNLRRGPVTSTCSSEYAKAGPGRTSSFAFLRAQTGARKRRQLHPAAHRCGSGNTWSWGGWRPPKPRPPREGRRRRRPLHPIWATYHALGAMVAHRGCCSTEKRQQTPSGSGAGETGTPYVKDAFHRLRGVWGSPAR